VLRTITKEILLIGAFYLAFALAKNLTDPSPVLKAVSNGWSLLRLESALALDLEAAIQQFAGRISLGAVIGLTYFYVAGMWLALIGMAVVLFIKKRAAYVNLRRVFIFSMILGAIVFALYPLAPPRFMPGLGMLDTVTLLGLDPAPTSDSAISYNRFAAMPSLHYTWALLVMLGTFKLSGLWIKVAGVAYQALMFVSIIATANHYVLDAVAGAILLVVAVYVNRWWNHYDDRMSQWLRSQTTHWQRVREVAISWRTTVGLIEVPNLRQQFLSEFILRGGHAVQPDRSRVETSRMRQIGDRDSFHPEFDGLNLVLR
jgi:hypothetical protein